jgi:hypothetical protein
MTSTTFFAFGFDPAAEGARAKGVNASTGTSTESSNLRVVIV